MINLLRDGQGDYVVKTTLSQKFTINGQTKAYPVYRVRLDKLFYNDQNDRIATWISQYKSENGADAFKVLEREEYNEIIEEFIVQSNEAAIEKTKNNIALVQQRQPGVILADGRVIDGNRRFTCLRQLSKKDSEFDWFETVILDNSIEADKKQIKMLELAIQHGEEQKVDYNQIDRLVGVYQDIVETELLTIEEYADSTNESVAEVRKKVEYYASQYVGEVAGGADGAVGHDPALAGVVAVVAVGARRHGLAEMGGVGLGHAVAEGLGETVVGLNAKEGGRVHDRHLYAEGVGQHHAGVLGEEGVQLVEGGQLIEAGGGEEELLVTAKDQKIVDAVRGFIESHLRAGEDGEAQLLPFVAGGVVALQAAGHDLAVGLPLQLVGKPFVEGSEIVVGDNHAAIAGGVVDAHQLGAARMGGQVAFRGVGVKLKEGHGDSFQISNNVYFLSDAG